MLHVAQPRVGVPDRVVEPVVVHPAEHVVVERAAHPLLASTARRTNSRLPRSPASSAGEPDELDRGPLRPPGQHPGGLEQLGRPRAVVVRAGPVLDRIEVVARPRTPAPGRWCRAGWRPRWPSARRAGARTTGSRARSRTSPERGLADTRSPWLFPGWVMLRGVEGRQASARSDRSGPRRPRVCGPDRLRDGREHRRPPRPQLALACGPRSRTRSSSSSVPTVRTQVGEVHPCSGETVSPSRSLTIATAPAVGPHRPIRTPARPFADGVVVEEPGPRSARRVVQVAPPMTAFPHHCENQVAAGPTNWVRCRAGSRG